MTNKELQDILKQFPDETTVYIVIPFSGDLDECNSVEFDPEEDGIFLDS